jgi:hypothetical protein
MALAEVRGGKRSNQFSELSQSGVLPMESLVAWLLLLVSCLAAVPAMAQSTVLYTSGPFNGTMCNLSQFPFCVPLIGPTNPLNMVADSFTLGACLSLNCNVTAIDFGVWVQPADYVTSVQVAIYPQSGFNICSPPPPLFTQTINLPSPICFTNDYGFGTCNEHGALSPAASLPDNASYYLVLSNASTVVGGGTVGWDVNGPPGPGNYYPVVGSTGACAPHKVGPETFSIIGY